MNINSLEIKLEHDDDISQFVNLVDSPQVNRLSHCMEAGQEFMKLNSQTRSESNEENDATL
jgi:hypothetical protein